MALIKKVAVTNANVLITGENGTGKELVAKEIHRLSYRSKKVMVSVDMGSLSENLFESELFGHKKGAFTDAQSDRVGKIEAANHGTLFLDEIGNLSPAMQAKLLSVLQSRVLTRVGDNQLFEVDIRLICATNSQLEKMVKQGSFREDLLYRINTIQIELPPLRERIEDIPKLADFFIKKYANKYDKKDLTLDHQALVKLKTYHWPGNVRELQHAIEKAVILSDHILLSASDFSFKTEEAERSETFGGTLEDMERQLIKAAIEKQKGNLSAVSSQLGVSRQTLYNKIKKYDL
jgi:transcriptional regulator with PAS, ATPase and Fis domain